jgi:hypothetical protein
LGFALTDSSHTAYLALARTLVDGVGTSSLVFGRATDTITAWLQTESWQVEQLAWPYLPLVLDQ